MNRLNLHVHNIVYTAQNLLPIIIVPNPALFLRSILFHIQDLRPCTIIILICTVYRLYI